MTNVTRPSLSPHQDEGLSIEQVEARVQHRRARHESYARVSAILLPIVTIVAALALWEIVVRVFQIPSFLLPTPTAIVLSFVNYMSLILKSWLDHDDRNWVGISIEHCGRRAVGVRYFHVAGILSLGLASAHFLASDAEGRGGAVAAGVVRLRLASEGADRVSDRIFPRCHQHRCRACRDRAGKDLSRPFDGIQWNRHLLQEFDCRMHCRRSSAD